MPKKFVCKAEDAFYGAVTVGERGQVVIPASARSDLEISPGDKLLVMRHPIYKGLVICKFADFQKILDDVNEIIANLELEKTEEDS